MTQIRNYHQNVTEIIATGKIHWLILKLVGKMHSLQVSSPKYLLIIVVFLTYVHKIFDALLAKSWSLILFPLRMHWI